MLGNKMADQVYKILPKSWLKMWETKPTIELAKALLVEIMEASYFDNFYTPSTPNEIIHKAGRLNYATITRGDEISILFKGGGGTLIIVDFDPNQQKHSEMFLERSFGDYYLSDERLMDTELCKLIQSLAKFILEHERGEKK